MIQITDTKQEEQMPALFRLAFRPFFLLGAFFSLLAMIVWGSFWHGQILLSPYGGYFWWHQHEMLFGFTTAIIVGFLFTAVQTWTGIRGLRGKPLASLVFLWIFGRALIGFPEQLPMQFIAIIDLSFLPVAGLILARYVVAVRQWRNFIFIPLLTLLTIANAQMHWGVYSAQAQWITQGAHSAVMIITLVMTVMGGRVIPFFTARGLKKDKPEPITVLEYMSQGGVLLLCLTSLFGGFETLPDKLLAGLFFIAASAQSIRFLRWRPWQTYCVPLLWSLHASFGFVTVGLWLWGAYFAGMLPSPTFGIHAITVGGMGGMILAMMSRVSLGHTGRSLVPPTPIVVGFFAMATAAFIRAIFPTLWPTLNHYAYSLSIGLWVIAYGLFLICYTKMLCQPRLDGRPG
ncbi:NnrS family protein [Algicola sagamiensis]|uniref:NnrS family protein n=1 Tax=Algicola sagamiensis TaxID=163869 RepID=UPI00036C4532|nr:NnrS family protein [Algicola sagamiensis]